MVSINSALYYVCDRSKTFIDFIHKIAALLVKSGCWLHVLDRNLLLSSQVKSSFHQFQDKTDNVPSQKYVKLPEKSYFWMK